MTAADHMTVHSGHTRNLVLVSVVTCLVVLNLLYFFEWHRKIPGLQSGPTGGCGLQLRTSHQCITKQQLACLFPGARVTIACTTEFWSREFDADH